MRDPGIVGRQSPEDRSVTAVTRGGTGDRARTLVQLLALPITTSHIEHGGSVCGGTDSRTGANGGRAAANRVTAAARTSITAVASRVVTLATSRGVSTIARGTCGPGRTTTRSRSGSRGLSDNQRNFSIDHLEQSFDRRVLLLVQPGVRRVKLQSERLNLVGRNVELGERGFVTETLLSVVWNKGIHDNPREGNLESIIDTQGHVVEDLSGRVRRGCDEVPLEPIVETELNKSRVRR